MAEISRDMDPEAAEAVARLLHFFGAGNSADSYTAPLFDIVQGLWADAKIAAGRESEKAKA